MSMKQTEFEGKLRTMEDTHRTSLNKLREDVTNQQRSTNQSVYKKLCFLTDFLSSYCLAFSVKR